MTISWWATFQFYLLALLAPFFGVTLVAAIDPATSVPVAHTTVVAHTAGETGRWIAHLTQARRPSPF